MQEKYMLCNKSLYEFLLQFNKQENLWGANLFTPLGITKIFPVIGKNAKNKIYAQNIIKAKLY